MYTICRIQLEFILECSDDDGSKMMQILLGAIPTTCQLRMQMQSLSSSMQQQRSGMSNKVLLQNYNAETSAAFVPLMLFHRHNKSGAGNTDSPVLKASDGLVCWLTELQQKGDESKIWSGVSISINTFIRRQFTVAEQIGLAKLSAVSTNKPSRITNGSSLLSF